MKKISFFVLIILFSFLFLLNLNEKSTKFDSSINQLCEDSDSLIDNSNSRYFDNSYSKNFESLYNFRDGITKEVPNKINVLTPNARRWYQNLENIANQETWDPDRFKGSFEAKIILKNNNYLCTMNGNIRFTGDYWDHISEKNNYKKECGNN